MAMLGTIWLLTNSDVRQTPRMALLITGLLVVIPLVQLIPLPPAIWHALPGRETARAALRTIDAEYTWRTWALDPALTLASLLAVLPVAWLLVAVARLNRRERLVITMVPALVAVLTIVLGAAQLSQGLNGPMRFYEPLSFYLDGFQANHNSTADVILIGMIAGFAALRELADRGAIPSGHLTIFASALAFAAVAGFGVALTASRMGIALLPLACLAGLVILRPWLKINLRRLAIGLGAVVAVVLIAALLLRNNGSLGAVFRRFSFTGEMRPGLWQDAIFAARQYFPFGAGMGNFIPAMLTGERLEIVQQTLPNRAHNELIELAIEAGVPGLAVWAVIAGLAVLLAWRARRAPPLESPGAALFAQASLLLLAIHSMVDYPFRSMALASLGAVCLGLLIPLRVAGKANSSGFKERE